ncbi:MAG: precorrin-8X methylmutase [Betaproteobacteria bacterium]|nr:precorrin-8X methylmutase [Betaproteobacteria bacterium]
MKIRWDLSGTEIEEESFRIIEAECGLSAKLSLPEWRVARRLIHTTADPRIADTLVFRHNAIFSGLRALRLGAPIFCDSKMIRAGLSIERLRRLNPDYGPDSLRCHISDPDIIARAKAEGLTRAFCAAEKARPRLEGAIVLIGNAPLALARIARSILEEGLRPALVVGMPVGFVNVIESKELLALCQTPQIVLEGRRGGSALAVATLHAVMESNQELPEKI